MSLSQRPSHRRQQAKLAILLIYFTVYILLLATQLVRPNYAALGQTLLNRNFSNKTLQNKEGRYVVVSRQFLIPIILKTNIGGEAEASI